MTLRPTLRSNTVTNAAPPRATSWIAASGGQPTPTSGTTCMFASDTVSVAPPDSEKAHVTTKPAP